MADLNTRFQALLPPAERKLPETNKEANGYTTATPVSDGRFVYVTYGSGMVGCYAMDGTRQWLHFFPEDTHRTYGGGNASSPVLVGNMLITHFLDMVALDAQTGKELWRVPHGHNWGTPAIVMLGKLTLLVTDGGEVVNAADGKTMATVMTVVYNSAVAKDDVVYCADRDKAQAYRLTVDKQGQVTSTTLWETKLGLSRYYASPLLAGGYLYLVNSAGALDVLEAATGKVAYARRLPPGRRDVFFAGAGWKCRDCKQ